MTFTESIPDRTPRTLRTDPPPNPCTRTTLCHQQTYLNYLRQQYGDQMTNRSLPSQREAT